MHWSIKIAWVYLTLFVSVTAQGGNTPLLVRVEGLALGNTLHLLHDGNVIQIDRNDEYLISGSATSGALLQLEFIQQPTGQLCAADGTDTVPADTSPVFIRCQFQTATSLVMPTTEPDNPLELIINQQPVRAWAYPGLPYESRLGVVGGIFPYEFRLSAARFNGTQMSTAAIQFDFRRGTLRFTPDAEGEYEFDVEIRDSAMVQQIMQRTLSVSVDTGAFLFVATNGINDPSQGSLENPFASVSYAHEQSTEDQLIVVRAGHYTLPSLSISNARAHQFLAFPDEVVQLNFSGTGRISVQVDQDPPVRIEGFDVADTLQWSVRSEQASNGLVIRRVRFLSGAEGKLPRENPAHIHGVGHGAATPRHQMLIQDNDFGEFIMNSSGAYAMTFFDVGHSLIENNQIHLGSVTGGIHDKDNSQHNTHRENVIEFTAGQSTANGIQVSAQANSERVHIHHNLLINAGIKLGTQCFSESCYMREHDVHHNTIVDNGITFSWGVFNAISFDTRISHNLIRHSSAPYAWASCLSSVPVDLATLLDVRANRLETTSSLALRDTECSGSPMNLSWEVWQNDYAHDEVSGGSLVSPISDLIGSGTTYGLPANDSRLSALGHRYPLASRLSDLIFANSFDNTP